MRGEVTCQNLDPVLPWAVVTCAGPVIDRSIYGKGVHHTVGQAVVNPALIGIGDEIAEPDPSAGHVGIGGPADTGVFESFQGSWIINAAQGTAIEVG